MCLILSSSNGRSSIWKSIKSNNNNKMKEVKWFSFLSLSFTNHFDDDINLINIPAIITILTIFEYFGKWMNPGAKNKKQQNNESEKFFFFFQLMDDQIVCGSNFVDDANHTEKKHRIRAWKIHL